MRIRSRELCLAIWAATWGDSALPGRAVPAQFAAEFVAFGGESRDGRPQLGQFAAFTRTVRVAPLTAVVAPRAAASSAVLAALAASVPFEVRACHCSHRITTLPAPM